MVLAGGPWEVSNALQSPLSKLVSPGVAWQMNRATKRMGRKDVRTKKPMTTLQIMQINTFGFTTPSQKALVRHAGHAAEDEVSQDPSCIVTYHIQIVSYGCPYVSSCIIIHHHVIPIITPLPRPLATTINPALA